MNPAILLANIASAHREELKSFLQDQKCDVDTAAGAMEIWATPPSLWDTPGRSQTLLRLKNYMDEQTKSAMLALAGSVDSKHNMKNGHSERLVAYAEQLGESLGFGEEDLQELRIASWLHDIGKIVVPESILLKPGALNAEERRIMREHSVIGENICAPLKSLRSILPVIRHHHEKMDGSGYPDGLSGEAIPLKARILQVADIYDALTTDRPYRGALPAEEALQILFSEAENGWLDASVVLKFSRICRCGRYFPLRGGTVLSSQKGAQEPLHQKRRPQLSSGVALSPPGWLRRCGTARFC